jgi:hypothetical protein
MAGSFAPTTSGTAALNHILTQEANRIGQDIYQFTLHQSPWLDLIKKGTFPEAMGYQLNTLIYDRALPQNDGANTGTFDALGLNWTGVASSALVADNSALNSAALIEGASIDRTGPRNKSARIDFTRKLKSYNLQRASVESPRINVDDLRFAAYRTEQLSAIMNILRESTHRSWEDRGRDEYDRLSDNVVVCKTAAYSGGSVFNTAKEGVATFGASGFFDTDVDSGSDGADDANAVVPTAFLSNKVLDKVYMKMVRAGAGINPYGRENARPVFGLILSSEASYALQTEPGFRDDIRYNSSKVSDLIAPLGVEKAFRGYYHMVDDLSPRGTFNGTSDKIERVYPEVYSSGVLILNTAYETAEYELAYVLHSEVLESLIPGPVSAPGLTFNPVNYRGDFKWLNIPDEVINPDGTIGFFRGVLASASKPIKTNYGYRIAFKRTVSDLAV